MWGGRLNVCRGRVAAGQGRRLRGVHATSKSNNCGVASRGRWPLTVTIANQSKLGTCLYCRSYLPGCRQSVMTHSSAWRRMEGGVAPTWSGLPAWLGTVPRRQATKETMSHVQ